MNRRGRAFAPQFLNFSLESRSANALPFSQLGTYGKGWSEKQLRHCLHFAETFPDEQIVSALRRQLSWIHIKTHMYFDDPLKRDFYIEICCLEGWSSRQLQERHQFHVIRAHRHFP